MGGGRAELPASSCCTKWRGFGRHAQVDIDACSRVEAGGGGAAKVVLDDVDADVWLSVALQRE